MRKFFTLFVLLISSFFSAWAQENVSDLFQSRNNLSRNYHPVVSKYQALQINKQSLSALRGQSPAEFQLTLPFENGEMKLNLEKAQITAGGFFVTEALPDGQRRLVDYSDGVFYQGTIEGKTKSMATISIFNDQVMGIIADEQGNIVLGAIEENGKATSEYTLYREKDLAIPNPFACGTSDIPVDGVYATTNNSNRVGVVGEPIEIYFECDYKFYLDKGSNTTNVINYVLGFFNNVALLYDNENVKVQVSQILVWTTQDPEAAAGLNTTGVVLPAFRNRMAITNFIGDYAHFLSTRSLGGGIAYLVGNPCATTKDLKTAVSAIDNTYNSVPTFSWTVEVVTHELGHNLGSNHTQWCGWTGGALDNCYTTEGGCPPGPQPSNGGTIMSYCHLVPTGINFNNGFGQQPGDRIRAVITAATCFGNCRMTINVTKVDASCSQNNGSATVTATNGTGTLTYQWSNGQTGATLNSVGPGTYHVIVADAAGCQVMQVVTIINSGPSLNATLSPSGTAAYCTGGNITLTATFNAAYTYQWSKGGVPIVGATSNTYVASTTGTYSVVVTSGACSSTFSVIVSEVPPPTANITAGGPTTICDGTSVVLDGTAGAGYTYQWFRNAAPISGATSATYSVTTSGTYTVQVSAGSCQVTSSPVSVTVNPSPLAAVTTTGLTSFCSGGSVLFTANSGTGYTYQWFRNAAPISGATTATYTATTSGTYTVAVGFVSGCSRTSTPITVTVFPNPTVTVTPVTSTIQKFQTQTLTATGALSYNWSSLPDLVSSTTTTGTYRPLTTRVYTVEGTDNNGCKGTATATINVIGCGDVTSITATVYSPSTVVVRWVNPSGVTTDTLQYRKVGSTTWIKVFVTGQEYELNGLEPGSNYEYNVIPLCTTTTVFVASATQTFQTAGLQNGIYVLFTPNPVITQGRLEIIVDKPYTVQVAIYDGSGKKIKDIIANENRPAGQTMKVVDVSVLPTGVYYVLATINGKKYDMKVLVTH